VGAPIFGAPEVTTVFFASFFQKMKTSLGLRDQTLTRDEVANSSHGNSEKSTDRNWFLFPHVGIIGVGGNGATRIIDSWFPYRFSIRTILVGQDRNDFSIPSLQCEGDMCRQKEI